MTWKYLLAVLLGGVACSTPLRGQELSAAAASRRAQSPPTFGVLDPQGFFYRNPGALKRISGQVLKLEQSRGYSIYLVVEPVLIGTTADERAAELHHQWVPGGNGLVVVYESDSRTLGIGRDLVGAQAAAGSPARIPSFETEAIISAATGSVRREVAPAAYLESLVGKLVAGFDTYFQRRAAPPPPARSMKFALLLVGTLSLLGLGAIGVGGLMRHSALAGTRSYHFPAVEGSERLGAPCGGHVISRRFAPPAEKT